MKIGRGSDDLHYDDGSHRSTSPSAAGHLLAPFERRLRAHLAEHGNFPLRGGVSSVTVIPVPESLTERSTLMTVSPDPAYGRLSRRIVELGLTAEIAPAAENPHLIDPDRGMSHWSVTLRGPGGEMVVPFSQGSAYNDPPVLRTVVECLVSDAGCAGSTFGDFCADFGYDEDSRRAFATWEAIEAQTAELVRILGGVAVLDSLAAAVDDFEEVAE